MNDHLTPVGKPAPPRPRRPESLISSITSAGSLASAFRSPVYPPDATYASSHTGLSGPHLAVVIRTGSAIGGLPGRRGYAKPGEHGGHRAQVSRMRAPGRRRDRVTLERGDHLIQVLGRDPVVEDVV